MIYDFCALTSDGNDKKILAKARVNGSVEWIQESPFITSFLEEFDSVDLPNINFDIDDPKDWEKLPQVIHGSRFWVETEDDLHKADFDETKHPRDKTGEFAPKGEGSAGAPDKGKEKESPKGEGKPYSGGSYHGTYSMSREPRKPMGEFKVGHDFKTGQNIYKLRTYRGESKNGKPADPGDLGLGPYYTTSESTAKAYGEVSAWDITLKNPLVINEKQAAALVEGYGTLQGDADQRRAAATRLSRAVWNAGYDGLMVKGWDSEPGHYTIIPITKQWEAEKPPKEPKPIPPKPPKPVYPIDTKGWKTPSGGLNHEVLKRVDLHEMEPTWKKNPGETVSYGAVLINDDGKIALREPSNHYAGYHWTFAKGKPDASYEHPLDVAEREVGEEMGYGMQVTGLVPGGYRGVTGKNFYFLAKPTSHDKQTDDETWHTKWVDKDEAKSLINQTTDTTGRQRDLKILDAAYDEHNKIKSGQKDYGYLFDDPEGFDPEKPKKPPLAASRGGTYPMPKYEGYEAFDPGHYVPELKDKRPKETPEEREARHAAAQRKLKVRQSMTFNTFGHEPEKPWHKVVKVSLAKATWDESKHPRGNEDNPGEFAPKGAGGSGHAMPKKGMRRYGEEKAPEAVAEKAPEQEKEETPKQEAAPAQPAKAEPKFKIPADAWYLDESNPERNMEATKQWAADVESRGWDAEEVVKLQRHMFFPQYDHRNYSPDWGTSAGTFVAYRAGGLDPQANGTYFGPSINEVDAYKSLHKDEDFAEYEVTLKNPAIYEDKNALLFALYPDIEKKFPKEAEEAKRNATESSPYRPRPQRWMLNKAYDKVKKNHEIDNMIVKELKKRGYDSLVLMNPERPCTREIMMIDARSSKKLRGGL